MRVSLHSSIIGAALLGGMFLCGIGLANWTKPQALVPDGLKPEFALRGACFGQEGVALLDGLDFASAERARYLAASNRLEVCVDEMPPVGAFRSRYLEVFAWPTQFHRVRTALELDKELDEEATWLPGASGSWTDQWLPKPYWLDHGIKSILFKMPPTAAQALRRCASSAAFKSVVRRGKLTLIAVAQRKALPPLGAGSVYEMYFRFGAKRTECFEVMPTLGVVYVGQFGRYELPLDLVDYPVF